MKAGLPPAAILQAIFAATFSALGIVLMKAGLTGDVHLLQLLCGLVVYGVGVLLGMLLLAQHALSVVYTIIVGLSLVVLSVLSVTALGETLTTRRVLGSMLVLVGVALLVRTDRPVRAMDASS